MPENKNIFFIFIGVSINKEQAKALAEGFLDDIGTNDKNTLQPKETFTELFVVAGDFIEDAQKNLIESNTNASGQLSKSLTLGEPKKNGNIVSIDILMNFYGRFVNSGVKGTKSGSGEFQFRNNFPSRGMIESLMAGIDRAKKSSTNVNKRKSIRANEIKNANISEISNVFGAARNIKMYGIKATGFIDKAIKTTADKIESKLGAALKIDIINSLQDGNNDTGNTRNL